MYLDREFDRDDSRRRLLRIHELGHALGYQHVESRTSIMNPSVGPEPTEFDRAWRENRVRATGRQHEPGHRPALDRAVGDDWRGPVDGAENGVRDAESLSS